MSSIISEHQARALYCTYSMYEYDRTVERLAISFFFKVTVWLIHGRSQTDEKIRRQKLAPLSLSSSINDLLEV